MGKLVVIEGLDGAGKRTLANGLTEALAAQGRTVAGHAFPRYGQSVHADLVRDGLYGRLGDLSDSVYGMAVLYALDRRGAADEIRKDLEEHDVVLLDRYVASSAAYSAARLHQDEHGEFVRWVRELEIDRFGLPVPDLHLLLRVPVEVAAERAAKREQDDDSRARDIYESDGSLQARCGVVYDGLANIGWLAPWQVVDGRSNVNFHSLLEPLFTP
ncbi:dTMP kinase [Lentzea sp. BCCO 10_0061]|uniref:Thymidylate kinase n=1 Tax=Lentzea sokolovensis TaxID=3095429 RepID=A0ABU4UVY2_9PSEU|nr:dTMP kinase [Lentzea sp. BCCO 10_0061]MDX8142906.1 dTMP kinase [Lentzea sp. BCCO 10_0061]